VLRGQCNESPWPYSQFSTPDEYKYGLCPVHIAFNASKQTATKLKDGAITMIVPSTPLSYRKITIIQKWKLLMSVK
jgi:hypothetical protein